MNTAVGKPLDLVVLAARPRSLLCRVLGTGDAVTLRTPVRDEVPGEIITVLPARMWTLGRHQHLSGKIESGHLDIAALGLRPLGLENRGKWDPAEVFADEPAPDWALPILARGPRDAFEMEQVIPGEDPDDPWNDPILEAADLREAGATGSARELIMSLTAADLRCIDAHAHLGSFELPRRPRQALRHYAVGIGIGAAALGQDFGGFLPWGFLDNRPYLRCLHGYALSLWQMGEFETAAAVFERLLRLNPTDDQGARFNLAEVQAGRSWSE